MGFKFTEKSMLLLFGKSWGSNHNHILSMDSFLIHPSLKSLSKITLAPPIQMLEYKKLASCSKKLTCCRRVNHSGLELQLSSSLIKGLGGLLRIHLTRNN